MRKLRDIAKDLREEVKLALESYPYTDPARKLAERLIEDFDQWDARNKAQSEYRAAKKSP